MSNVLKRLESLDELVVFFPCCVTASHLFGNPNFQSSCCIDCDSFRVGFGGYHFNGYFDPRVFMSRKVIHLCGVLLKLCTFL